MDLCLAETQKRDDFMQILLGNHVANIFSCPNNVIWKHWKLYIWSSYQMRQGMQKRQSFISRTDCIKNDSF